MVKKALGRGLDALIPSSSDEEQSSREIPIQQIDTNPYQPRSQFDQQGLEELAQSIDEHGLLQPILVRPVDGRFQLVAGERRFRAAKMAGMRQIPAIEMDLTDLQVAEIALVENLQREDLNPLEEASAYQKLIDEFSLTQDALAQRLGKSRSAIANTLRLLRLEPSVQALVAQGKLSSGHARTLVPLSAPQQEAAAAQIVDKGMTVRAAEGKRKERKAKDSSQDPNTVALQQQLMEHLGTKVVLEEKAGGRGRVIIEFYSPEDAQRVVENILRT